MKSKALPVLSSSKNNEESNKSPAIITVSGLGSALAFS